MLLFVLPENRTIVVWIVVVIITAIQFLIIWKQQAQIDELSKKDKKEEETKDKSIVKIYLGE